MTLTRAITVWFGAGLLPKAPGTWGSLAALPLAWGLHWLGGFPLLLVATVVVFAVGLWATRVETAGRADHDPSEIVVDEVVGQWIALWGLSAGLWVTGAAPHVFPWPGVVMGFVLFRLLDISKPWPVSYFDRMKTPFGVMMDDVVAGAIVALTTLLGAAFSHGWLG
ncbi:phosphatidylglycerophosphatase A [Rubricella aquisinus]|uniref:Phosphatidylglycerophosphatase A n=1 Tax=Rubricella aquisinus TaxID=2028108 RepID=A0A840WWT2_9RHOB|nr:phosphatidylglycerophosphatase A [Rubricella aquisinus]MBB5514784.1 phosphatidylglycerophosphatase A [Rubricella aquisinus]